jgi:anti-sigma regulatory factor (Ser/Thr protein kinase)
MSAELDSFRSGYGSAFRAYLAGGGEVGLESAYELGRQAVTGELSLLELAGIHQAVLADALEGASEPGELGRIARAGTDFFLESLATFEMTQRGFREARETAQLQQRHADQLRGLAEAALAVNSALSEGEMLELVEERAREIVGAEQSSVTVEGTPGDRLPAPLREPARLAAPLIARDGQPLGVIELSGKRDGEFTADDESILVQLAQMASVAIVNARLFERERGIAAELQSNLLPESLPDIPGVATAARYIAGGDGVEVGGDWYEVIRLSEDRVGVAIGDVVGRGVRAAATMGQLRVALRAYALELGSPALVARRLARFVRTLDRDQMTTCVYAVLEPASGRLVCANAGHPPPLVLTGDGRARYLNGDSGLPLGVMGDFEYGEWTTTLEPGSTLLLYTDGLVEKRGELIDAGLERLRLVVTDAVTDPNPLCDHVLGALGGRPTSDDVALLAVRALPLAGEPLDLTLAADPDELAPLRRRLTVWLTGAGASEQERYDVILAVCEAAANSIEHAYGPGPSTFRVTGQVVAGELTIDVTDNGRWRPGRDPRRGRGLSVMREAMDEVEVSTGEEGTNVQLRRRLGG